MKGLKQLVTVILVSAGLLGATGVSFAYCSGHPGCQNWNVAVEMTKKTGEPSSEEVYLDIDKLNLILPENAIRATSPQAKLKVFEYPSGEARADADNRKIELSERLGPVQPYYTANRNDLISSLSAKGIGPGQKVASNLYSHEQLEELKMDKLIELKYGDFIWSNNLFKLLLPASIKST